mmetsp:Transcript_8848/g.32622  ORF Transcript_8848/g.32622 Transcript_8848/m.32622 type:complete len:725 (-) Transcript_8848:795-2969(-)
MPSKTKELLAAGVQQLLPCLSWMRRYTWHDLQGDLIAGITVGVMVVPQSLTYAPLANLSPQYGLYSSYLAPAIYGFLGTSKDVTVGPTAILSTIVGGNAEDSPDGAVTYALAVSFLAGLVQLLLGVCRLGSLVDLISVPVLSSFVSSAAISISVGQLYHILGLEKQYLDGHSIRRPFLECVEDTVKYIHKTRGWTLLMGSTCILLIEGGKWLSRLLKQRGYKRVGQGIQCGRIAAVMSAAALTTFLIVDAAERHQGEDDDIAEALSKHAPWACVGTLPEGVPAPSADFASHIWSTLKSEPIIVAVVAFMAFFESIAIATYWSRINGYSVQPSQELRALGMCNLVGSFVGAYPNTGSFSRTAINSAANVRTPGSGFVVCGTVLLATFTLADAFAYIPKAALSAVVIPSVLSMGEPSVPLHLYRCAPLELVPYCACFISSLVLGLQYGIVIGILVAMLVNVICLARPAVAVLDGHGDSTPSTLKKSASYVTFEENLARDVADQNSVLLRLSIEGPLCFYNATYIQRKTMAALQSRVESEQANGVGEDSSGSPLRGKTVSFEDVLQHEARDNSSSRANSVTLEDGEGPSRGSKLIVIDCSGVPYCDYSAAAALCTLQRTLLTATSPHAPAPIILVLSHCQPNVSRVVRLVGTAHGISMEEFLADFDSGASSRRRNFTARNNSMDRLRQPQATPIVTRYSFSSASDGSQDANGGSDSRDDDMRVPLLR